MSVPEGQRVSGGTIAAIAGIVLPVSLGLLWLAKDLDGWSQFAMTAAAFAISLGGSVAPMLVQGVRERRRP